MYYEKSWLASVLAMRKKDAHVNFKKKEREKYSFMMLIILIRPF